MALAPAQAGIFFLVAYSVANSFVVAEDGITAEILAPTFAATEFQFKRALMLTQMPTRSREERREAKKKLDALTAGEFETVHYAGKLVSVTWERGEQLTGGNSAVTLFQAIDDSNFIADVTYFPITVYPRRSTETRVDRVWFEGVDASKLTSSHGWLQFDGVFIERPTKGYTTVVGSIERIRHLVRIDESVVKALWKKHVEKNLIPRMPELIAEAKAEAKKQTK